jgi:cytoskeletal protein RodZ
VKKLVGRAAIGLTALGVAVSVLGWLTGPPSPKPVAAAEVSSSSSSTSSSTTTTTTVTTTTTTVAAETLTEKLDRFFAGDPNLASVSPAARRCAEAEMAPTMTTYTLDTLLASDHTDPSYQAVVTGAKMIAGSGCTG